MMRGFAWFTLLCALGCGADPGDTHIAFKMHQQVACNREGMKANLEASEVPGVCPLTVRSDRTVSGTCFGVPAGAVRAFRLTYYATFDRDYELAVASTTLDLTKETRKTVILEFPEESLVVSQDDDGDFDTNLVEFCCGSHPGINAETCR